MGSLYEAFEFVLDLAHTTCEFECRLNFDICRVCMVDLHVHIAAYIHGLQHFVLQITSNRKNWSGVWILVRQHPAGSICLVLLSVVWSGSVSSDLCVKLPQGGAVVDQRPKHCIGIGTISPNYYNMSKLATTIDAKKCPTNARLRYLPACLHTSDAISAVPSEIRSPLVFYCNINV